jgi:PAS domain S-box-containing protein
MNAGRNVNILLVDDQPAKLLSYETILGELGENLVKASSAREALELLLKLDIAVILVDVCMPELDGFQLAEMIREHPRFRKTAIIFVSAVHLTDVDRLRAYEIGAVDYVPVPVVPEVLRAKVRVFVELYRKTRELEQLNEELERRVAERTAELAASAAHLEESERRRTLALAAGQMGSWEWDPVRGSVIWDDGQYRIFGVEKENFSPSFESIKALIHPEDRARMQHAMLPNPYDAPAVTAEFRVTRPTGEVRWCIGTAVTSVDATDHTTRISGVTIDITDRKSAEERQSLLAREVDHRARNALALVQSIVRLTRADSVASYVDAVEGRIGALARAHTLLAQSRWQGTDLARVVDEELAPYRPGHEGRIVTGGPECALEPRVAQTLALALHELSTNAAKYGALTASSGEVHATWELRGDQLALSWRERGGPPVSPPTSRGFGIRVISASIEQQLAGTTSFEWRPEGLHCTLTVPRGEEIGQSRRTGARYRCDPQQAGVPLQVAEGGRILLVEDEALVAMMLRDVLTELGFEVIGPFGRLADAMVVAIHETIDAGMIDVNLGGELVYPIADVLLARRIPFIFVTGYGVDGMERRFRHVPVYKKPVQRHALQQIFVSAGTRRPSGSPRPRRSVAEQ